MSDEAREAVNENQNRLAESRLAEPRLGESGEQIMKPAPKGKPLREKDPKKVAAGKKLAKKNRQAKAALDREVKREREMAEKEQENENSPGWLPEMSFQTVLSIVGIVFTAIELYQRFRQKDSSGGGINAGDGGAVQNPISSITEQKQSGAVMSGAPSRALTQHSPERSADRRSERSADRRPERSGVQKSEWFDNNLFFNH